MSETIKAAAAWLTTSGIKILGILITLFILSQMSRWITGWLELGTLGPLSAAAGIGILNS